MKPRYKVKMFDGAAPLICRDIKELVDQLSELDDTSDVRIETVLMTDDEMNSLPEFEGP